MATVIEHRGTPEIPNPEERTAVYLGVRRVLAARPEGEAWSFAVCGTHGDNYVFTFERSGEPFGSGLSLSVGDLHHRGQARPGREHVTEAVREDVALYVRDNLAE